MVPGFLGKFGNDPQMDRSRFVQTHEERLSPKKN